MKSEYPIIYFSPSDGIANQTIEK